MALMPVSSSSSLRAVSSHDSPTSRWPPGKANRPDPCEPCRSPSRSRPSARCTITPTPTRTVLGVGVVAVVSTAGSLKRCSSPGSLVIHCAMLTRVSTAAKRPALIAIALVTSAPRASAVGPTASPLLTAKSAHVTAIEAAGSPLAKKARLSSAASASEAITAARALAGVTEEAARYALPLTSVAAVSQPKCKERGVKIIAAAHVCDACVASDRYARHCDVARHAAELARSTAASHSEPSAHGRNAAHQSACAMLVASQASFETSSASERGASLTRRAAPVPPISPA
mmetsp:Transcript_2861/g.5973  ORF Transcript_2861/g.5973 Transcript_2861/m.5973 type:complete len:287 (-) Transcript_2861:372-1232(-)